MFATGIDVSKRKLDVTLVGGETTWTGTFENTPKGCKALVKVLKKRSAKGSLRCSIEPTATYHLTCATMLHRARIPVMLVNPRWSCAMAKAVGQRGKTDKADSAMLAEFSLREDFKAWEPPNEAKQELRALVRRRAQLVRTRTKEKNRAKEVKATQVGLSVLEDIQEFIAFLDTRTEKLEQAIKALIGANAELKKKAALLKSLPGVGDIIAAIVVSELGFMPDDLNTKQLVAMAGLDPMPKQSGTRDGRRSISKRGNKHLRTAMFLGAWSAPRGCPHVRAWREAMLDRGKAKKVVTVALARRLLVAAATVLKTGVPWDGRRFYPLDGLDR